MFTFIVDNMCLVYAYSYLFTTFYLFIEANVNFKYKYTTTYYRNSHFYKNMYLFVLTRVISNERVLGSNSSDLSSRIYSIFKRSHRTF